MNLGLYIISTMLMVTTCQKPHMQISHDPGSHDLTLGPIKNPWRKVAFLLRLSVEEVMLHDSLYRVNRVTWLVWLFCSVSRFLWVQVGCLIFACQCNIHVTVMSHIPGIWKYRFFIYEDCTEKAKGLVILQHKCSRLFWMDNVSLSIPGTPKI